MHKLIDYFSSGITSRTLQTVGMEIETQFVDESGQAIDARTSQKVLGFLVGNGWDILKHKSGLVTTITDKRGNKIFQEFEMGRHHLEIATAVSTSSRVLGVADECLAQLYDAAHACGAKPYCAPILDGAEDLLIRPNERDTVWIQLDDRYALAPLARTSSVQFTISMAPQDAVRILNLLGRTIDSFLSDFPQDAAWKRYVAASDAKYLPDRYGGPLLFGSLDDYCRKLTRHDVVQGIRLVPYTEVENLDVPSYVRSIWWHFRLRRYDNDLCIEVRPIARRADEQLQCQLEKVLAIVCK